MTHPSSSHRPTYNSYQPSTPAYYPSQPAPAGPLYVSEPVSNRPSYAAPTIVKVPKYDQVPDSNYKVVPYGNSNQNSNLNRVSNATTGAGVGSGSTRISTPGAYPVATTSFGYPQTQAYNDNPYNSNINHYHSYPHHQSQMYHQLYSQPGMYSSMPVSAPQDISSTTSPQAVYEQDPYFQTSSQQQYNHEGYNYSGNYFNQQNERHHYPSQLNSGYHNNDSSATIPYNNSVYYPSTSAAESSYPENSGTVTGSENALLSSEFPEGVKVPQNYKPANPQPTLPVLNIDVMSERSNKNEDDRPIPPPKGR